MNRALLAVIMGIFVLGGSISHAAAESGSVDSPRGDAPARIDITKLRVDNGNRWFEMRVDVANLRQNGRFNFHYWGGRGRPPGRSVIIAVRRVDGQTRAEFLRCGREDCAPASCPRLRVRWSSARDFVRVAAPQRCYPRPADSPDAPAPAFGRFFAWSSMGDAVDSGPASLRLDRG